MTGHIRKRSGKSGASWQITLDKGVDTQGKRQREYITVNGTKKEAQATLTEKISQFNRGTYIEPSQLTVEDCIHQWMKVYAVPRLAPSTINGYKVNFEKHTIPYIGNVKLQQLTPVQIQDMFTLLADKGLKPRTIKYVHTTLREALQYAYKMRMVPQNVADFVSPPKQEKFKASVYTEEEAIQLLQHASGTDMDIPLHLALGLGLRRGELLALYWKDIDFQNKIVTICRNLVCINKEFRFDNPKTESGNRTILLSQSLLEKLKKHKIAQAENQLFLGQEYENNDLICCRPDGKPYHTGSFSHKFSQFLKKNGLRHIRLHDLRHTNATLMMKYGVHAKIASERLGHSNIAITLDTYSHVSPEMQTDATNKLESGIFDKLDQKIV
ncbi:tyrosine-type recombinase/integrase [Oscillospiraceae bacterium PP1C4]